MKKRSSLQIMLGLLNLAWPYLGLLALAILTGLVSFLASTGFYVLAGLALAQALGLVNWGLKNIFIAMGLCVLVRGLFRYFEQYLNHLVAFHVLAMVRNKVFAQVRVLAPAKLQGIDRGDLVSLIGSDIELVEVFYAHTISPIVICLVSGLIYFFAFGQISYKLSFLGLAAYLVLGLGMPMFFSKRSKDLARGVRESIGQLNNKFLDLIRGIREIIQFAYEERAIEIVRANNKDLQAYQGDLVGQLALVLALEDIFRFAFSALALGLACQAQVPGPLGLTIFLGFYASLGPVMPIASLSNGLAQSLAAGERILNLLEEEPLVEEINDGQDLTIGSGGSQTLISIKNLGFSYGTGPRILDDFSLEVKKGEILGLSGPSGCGKSTLLKLIMRFWPVDEGQIQIQGLDIEQINTRSLLDSIAYMTQETEFFEGTIRDNLIIAKPGARDEDIWACLGKASAASFVRSLPQGLDTQLSELGDNFSGGERQRLGLARCFLKDPPILLLDEPTSNLDILNERIILRSLRENIGEKTVILVSHRQSSLEICDRIAYM